MATIIRQSYIDKIERYLGKETIIVLVGQRRVGKSCMMKMIRDRKKADDSNNIIFIDKEKREFDNIQTYQDLNDYIGEHFLSDKHNYILIDEIQDIREFKQMSFLGGASVCAPLKGHTEITEITEKIIF